MPVCRITCEDLRKTAEETACNNEMPEVIVFGCPHLSKEELKYLSQMLDGKKRINPGIKFWVFTSRYLKEVCPGEIKVIEKFGKVFADTCMVVSPIESLFTKVGVDSAKAYRYLHGHGNIKALLRPREEWLKLIAE